MCVRVYRMCEGGGAERLQPMRFAAAGRMRTRARAETISQRRSARAVCGRPACAQATPPANFAMRASCTTQPTKSRERTSSSPSSPYRWPSLVCVCVCVCASAPPRAHISSLREALSMGSAHIHARHRGACGACCDAMQGACGARASAALRRRREGAPPAELNRLGAATPSGRGLSPAPCGESCQKKGGGSD